MSRQPHGEIRPYSALAAPHSAIIYVTLLDTYRSTEIGRAEIYDKLFIKATISSVLTT